MTSSVFSVSSVVMRFAALPLHPIPCRRHHLAQTARRLPLQQRLRLRRIRHQRRRISRAPRHHLVRHALAGHFLDRGNHFLHGSSGARSNVDRKAFLPCRQIIQRLHVRARQIVHVDVVAHAGSIGRRIIRPKHLQLRTKPSGRAQRQRNQVGLRVRAIRRSRRFHPLPPR